ncbi:MAG TPA: diguanylate cyclase [Xanthobacteraceae bacterium]|jgi:diguanylate cyclase (GGDEF)-like protein|nr:diguanylate cyclase [Xanthobacteraceae bacterium]
MRVVLVDPSRTVLKLVGRLLEARGHEVRAFTDGQAALDCIRLDLSVGALITSAELNSMSGMELCWEARLLATCNRQIYVILMSSSQDRHTLIEALDSGADDYIGKPPIAEELYARLRAAERVATMHDELIRLATTDPLTGVLNRRAFFERAREVCARADAGGALSAILFDIDHFKRVNDLYGHDVGDRAIRAVAQAAAGEELIVGRLGGEEFAALVDGQGLDRALALAERLRQNMASLKFDTSHGRLTLTCSFGVSEWEPGDTIDFMLKRADVALYAAKTGGRNRVVAANAGQQVDAVPPSGFLRSVARG